MPPVIDQEKCIACGTCIDVCSEDVFLIDKRKVENGENLPVTAHPEFCYHCYLCVKECPAEAIWLRTPMTMTVPFK